MAGCITPASSACAALWSGPVLSCKGPCSPSFQRSSLTPRMTRLTGVKVHFERRSTHVVRSVASELSEFSVQESSKFREGLLEQLQANQVTAGDKEKIADICAKIFGGFVERYDGTLSPEPFGEMKAALDREGLPGGAIAIRAAIGWSRGYLYHDWRTWTTQK